MKTIKLLLCFFPLILGSCMDNTLSEERKIERYLLTFKKWNFHHFEPKNTPSSNTNFRGPEFESFVNDLFKNVSIKFNDDDTGIMEHSSGTKSDFNWVRNENILSLEFPNEPHRDRKYILNSISFNELNISFERSVYFLINGIEVSASGDYIFSLND